MIPVPVLVVTDGKNYEGSGTISAVLKSEILIQFPKLSRKDFDFFAALLKKSSGIRIQPSRISMVESRLSRRLRHRGMASWKDYIDLLNSGDREELSQFVNILTTNKSEFFRERTHFDYVLDDYLPSRQGKSLNPLNAWIAAASYGQEAYTLAMLLEEHFEEYRLDYRILATDIDSYVLQVAHGGVYPQSDVERDVNSYLLSKYFLRGSGNNSGFYKIADVLQKRIKFRRHNLCDFDSKIPLQFDLIMARNILIYFDAPTVERCISKMVDNLVPGGLLILGHCEAIIEMKWNLTTVSPSIYRKNEDD